MMPVFKFMTLWIAKKKKKNHFLHPKSATLHACLNRLAPSWIKPLAHVKWDLQCQSIPGNQTVEETPFHGSH